MEHSKACFAHAVICAIENARDDEHFSPNEFLRALRTAEVVDWAEGYLTSGLASCTCGWNDLTPADKVILLMREGWTYESAAAHVDGTCDGYGACTGIHEH